MCRRPVAAVAASGGGVYRRPVAAVAASGGGVYRRPVAAVAASGGGKTWSQKAPPLFRDKALTSTTSLQRMSNWAVVPCCANYRKCNIPLMELSCQIWLVYFTVSIDLMKIKT